MGKQPRKVEKIPEGYVFSHKDEVTGKDIYKIKSETPAKSSSTLVRKPSAPKPTGATTVLKAPIKRKTPPTLQEDFVYIEPASTTTTTPTPTVIPIKEDLRIDRKLQPPINPNIDFYQYPDPNAGYSKPTSMYFDKITQRPVDVIKSIGADGVYNPIYTDTLTANEGKYQGTVKQGNPRVTTTPEVTDVMEGVQKERAGTKGLGTTMGTVGFKYGGKIPKMAEGGGVKPVVVGYNYKGEPLDENGQVITDLGMSNEDVGKGILNLTENSKSNPVNTGSVNNNSISGIVNKLGGKSALINSATNLGVAGAGLGATYIDSKNKDDRGRYTDENAAIGSNALKGAGIGAKLGSNPALMGATGGTSMLIGAGAGAIGGGIYGKIKADKDKAAIKKSAETRANELSSANASFNQSKAIQNRNANEDFNDIESPYTKDNAYFDENDKLRRGLTQYAAEGGEIKGKGTAKSDSIKAEVKEGSFVVPAENAELAKGIRKLYLKAPSKKANLKQENGEDVRLSNGEHLFTPEENEYLESIGIDLEDLAPNSEYGEGDMDKGGLTANKARMILHDKKVHGKPLTEQQRKFFGAISNGASIKMACGGEVKGYAEGGPVKGTKVDGATWNGKNWVSDNGSVYSGEGGKKFTEKYNQQLSKAKLAQEQKTGSELNVYKRKLKEANDSGNTEEANRLQVKINQLSGLKQAESKAVESKPKVTSKPSLKAPVVKKKEVVAPFTVNANPDEEVIVPNGQLSPNQIAAINSNAVAENEQVNALNKSLPQNTTEVITPQNKRSGLSGLVRNFDPTSVVGLGQMYLGNKMLKGQERPKDVAMLDSTYNASVNRALEDAKSGLSPEEKFMAQQDIESAKNEAIAKGVNYAGGSGTLAFNLSKSAINDAWKNKLGLKHADMESRIQKQKYADAMVADRANILAGNRRQAFNDAMNTFQQKQKSGSELVGAGLQNLIGAYRFNKDQQAIDRANAERNPWTRNI